MRDGRPASGRHQVVIRPVDIDDEPLMEWLMQVVHDVLTREIRNAPADLVVLLEEIPP